MLIHLNKTHCCLSFKWFASPVTIMHLTVATRHSISKSIFNTLFQYPARPEHPASPQRISSALLCNSALKCFLNGQLDCSGANESKAVISSESPNSEQTPPKNTNTSEWKKKHSTPKSQKMKVSTGINRARILWNNWETNREHVKRENVTIYFLTMPTLAFCCLVLPSPFSRLQFLARHEEHPCGAEYAQTNNFPSQCRGWSLTTFSSLVKKMYFP